MATRYTAANVEIHRLEDFEAVLKKNQIIPEYKNLLLEVNKCIIKIESLEDRTYFEMLSDWVSHIRIWINVEKLIKDLQELRSELLKGIAIYNKVLKRKEDTLKPISVASDLTATKILKYKSRRPSELENQEKRLEEKFEQFNAVTSSSVKMISITPKIRKTDEFIIEARIMIINNLICIIARDDGGRAIKYRRIKELQDEFERADILANLQTDHQFLNTLLDSS